MACVVVKICHLSSADKSWSKLTSSFIISETNTHSYSSHRAFQTGREYKRQYEKTGAFLRIKACKSILVVAAQNKIMNLKRE